MGYKINFISYYPNDFNKIEYNDQEDIGILIDLYNHVCCFFICNNTQKYYNDNDNIILNCDWKELLKKTNDTNNLNYAHCNDDLNKNTNKNTNLIQKVQEKYSMNIQNSMNIDDSEYLDEYPVIEYMGKLFKEKQIDVYNNSDDVNMYYEDFLQISVKSKHGILRG